ncbi:MAG: hypothetical protein LBJ77_01715 [Holosporales bacterium]|nr:hypothetical protein [Holosporales bacterium]
MRGGETVLALGCSPARDPATDGIWRLGLTVGTAGTLTGGTGTDSTLAGITGGAGVAAGPSGAGRTIVAGLMGSGAGPPPTSNATPGLGPPR